MFCPFAIDNLSRHALSNSLTIGEMDYLTPFFAHFARVAPLLKYFLLLGLNVPSEELPTVVKDLPDCHEQQGLPGMTIKREYL